MRSQLTSMLPGLAALFVLVTAQVATPLGNVAAQPLSDRLREHLERPPLPQLQLPQHRSQGQRAIDLLGNRLPEVAAHYRKSPDEFRAMLLLDSRLKLDRNGRLLVEEDFDGLQPTGIEPSQLQGTVDGALAPLEQTFVLHSRPGAKRTLYLNFKGAVLTNTAWNSTGATIVAPPFDTDGVPNTYSTAELQRIQYIWQRVVEDFAPFDIDVTTEQPPADKLTRSGSSDDVYGTTALITKRAGVYSCGCGGVAYVGVFDGQDYYKPALVFYDALGANEKSVAEAISHEVGHNLGLRHDGNANSAYYSGHGSGAIGWAPIMGVGYSRLLSQWSKGEYATASNAEDDLAVMQINGLPLRADDHGDTVGNATLMAPASAGGSAAFAVGGVIEQSTDRDYFAFTSGPGTVSFTVAPAARAANLDARIELRNAAGAVLASANPATALGATLSATLASGGTYYIVVQGTGYGDVLGTGYSAYGSLGQYILSGTAPVSSNLPPTAVLAANPTTGSAPLTVGFNSAGSADSDGSLTAIDWIFGDGSSAAGATASHTYTTAGSYTAQLRVTDNSGLSSTRSVTINVMPAVAVMSMGSANIDMLLIGKYKNHATASVTIRDQNGNPVTGATVSGDWSGLVSGSGSALTNAAGVAVVTSSISSKRGAFTFTVTGVARAGYMYQPTLNVEARDSITR